VEGKLLPKVFHGLAPPEGIPAGWKRSDRFCSDYTLPFPAYTAKSVKTVDLLH